MSNSHERILEVSPPGVYCWGVFDRSRIVGRKNQSLHTVADVAEDSQLLKPDP